MATGDDTVYAALIGDIRASREIDDRADVQDRLRGALADISETAPCSLVADFVITTGDEFQALYDDATPVVEAMGRISEALPELTFAFGAGVGGLDTELREEAVGMDGPCFHAARQALEQAKHKDRWAQAAGLPEPDTRLVDSMLALLGATRSDWTPTQARYARARRDAATLQEVAEAFDRAKSSVSESLSAAHAREVHAAERELGHHLALLVEDAVREGHLP